MVHTIKSTLSDTGEGIGNLYSGIAPIAILPVYFGAAELVKGTMKRARKEVEGKKAKKKKVKHAKKKK
jgi:hypothetical protein